MDILEFDARTNHFFHNCVYRDVVSGKETLRYAIAPHLDIIATFKYPYEREKYYEAIDEYSKFIKDNEKIWD